MNAIKSKLALVTLQVVLILSILFLIGLLNKTNAQFLNDYMFKYRGIEAAFGAKTFKITSDIPEVSNLSVVQEGGSAGFIFGNDYSHVGLRVLGLYYSGQKRTIDMMEFELNSNVYLLQAFNVQNTPFEVYAITGVSNQHVKFFGHYINEEQRQGTVTKKGAEPYLGKIVNVNLNLGVGVEYRLWSDFDFLHFFAEAKTTFSMSTDHDVQAFENTSLADSYALNIGVRFGKRGN